MTQTQKALNDALNMLYAISIGKSFEHSEFMGRVIAMERILDPAIDTDHGALIHFNRRPSQ